MSMNNETQAPVPGERNKKGFRVSRGLIYGCLAAVVVVGSLAGGIKIVSLALTDLDSRLARLESRNSSVATTAQLSVLQSDVKVLQTGLAEGKQRVAELQAQVTAKAAQGEDTASLRQTLESLRETQLAQARQLKALTTAYQWLFVNSGVTDWIQQQYALQMGSDNELTRQLSGWSGWLAGYLHEYLMATVWVTIITLIRVTILALSLPLFAMAVLVALVEGLGQRDLRRYGAGYESSFVYHHAKKMVKPAVVVPVMLYLSWPTAVYPNLLLLPAAILLGTAITVTTASFKKYL